MSKIHERLAGDRPGLWESALTPSMLTQVAGMSEPRWSPDGAWACYVQTRNGEGRILAVPTAGGPELQITSDPAAQASGSYGGGYFDWSPDGRALVYLARDSKLWIVPARGGRSWRLAEGDGRQRAPAWSPDGRAIAYSAETAEQSAIAIAEIATGGGAAWPRQVSGNADFVQDPAWSPDARRLAWHEWDVPNMPWDGSRIVLADLSTGERRTVAGGDDVATAQPRFSPDGQHLAFLADRGGWLNLWIAAADGSGARPLLQESFEHGPPAWSPGARTYAWSPDGQQVAYLRNDDGHWQVRVVDVASGATRSVDDSAGVRAGLAWSSGNDLLFVHAASTAPPSIQALSLETGLARTLALAGAGGLAEAAVAAEPLRWTGRDGATLHGHVYRPRRATSQPTPLLVMLHGGPTGQFGVGWNGQIQYFVQRGWTVFTPEYRGSTGYGRDYAQALRENWGVHDVNDTVDGIDHLVAAGGIDRERVVVMGGSAGGYTVLMLLALAGDRIRAGVDLFGVADLWELNEGTHRLEAHYNHHLVGPLPEAARRYDERSPIYLSDRIKAPLLVLQGDSDAVVLKGQSDALVEAVRRHGGMVEYHVYEGEGHGWARIETTRDALETIDRFLANSVLLQ
ncbi:MAG TPA: S9 family peptidase [Chloroflexota bacterium]|nr:S9 family peptidase [Chloroflexota bacterium]